MFKSKILLLIAFLGLTFSSSYARMSDTVSTFERRVLSSVDGAIKITDEDTIISEFFKLPYKNIFLVVPDTLTHSFYFKKATKQSIKTSELKNISSEDGWLVHIVSYNGKVILEYYKRQGKTISSFEINALMELNANEFKWQGVKVIGGAKKITIETKDIFSRATSRNTFFGKLHLALNDLNRQYDKNLRNQKDSKKQQKRNYNPSTPSYFLSDTIDISIPNQKDTSLGYSSELEDKSVRSIKIANGLLFIDSSFDKSIRLKLDTSFEKEQPYLKDKAVESVYRF